MARVTVTREELYEQVWTTPLTRLALQYGVSNVALGKTCRRLNIPLPGRGYWAKRAAGHKVKRPPLPKAKGNEGRVHLEMDPTPVEQKPRVEVPPVPVPDSLSDAHAVVRAIASKLKAADVDEHDRIKVGSVFVVTAEAHRRALLLLDGLCKAFEARGHSIAFDGGVKVAVGEEEIALSIEERLDRVPHELTSEEKLQLERNPRYGVRKWDEVPCGRLRITVHDRQWNPSYLSDLKKRPLERALGQVVLGIEHVAAERKAQREKAERQRVEAEERRRQQAEESARQEKQKKVEAYRLLLAKDLEWMAEDWQRAKRIRDFLDAYEKAVPEEDRSDAAKAWLDAARKYAARIDPLGQNELVPKPLELDGEELERALKDLKKAEQERKESK